MPWRRASSSRRRRIWRADAPAAQPGHYRDATDLTGGVQAPGANWVTVQAGEDVNAPRILAIPLVFGSAICCSSMKTARRIRSRSGAVRIPARPAHILPAAPPRAGASSAARERLGEARVRRRRERSRAARRAASGRPSVATNCAQLGCADAAAAREFLQLLVAAGDAVRAQHGLDRLREHFPVLRRGRRRCAQRPARCARGRRAPSATRAARGRTPRRGCA